MKFKGWYWLTFTEHKHNLNSKENDNIPCEEEPFFTSYSYWYKDEFKKNPRFEALEFIFSWLEEEYYTEEYKKLLKINKEEEYIFNNNKSIKLREENVIAEEIEKKKNYDKFFVKIVIIDDIEIIRKKIIKFLPDFLWDDFILEFVEINNLEDALLYYNSWINNLLYNSNELILLDNTFYFDKMNRQLSSNSWLELYNFLTEADKVHYENNPYWKDVAENIAIISWLPKWVLQRKYSLSVDANFISWKNDSTDEFLDNLWKWIKNKFIYK